MAKPTSTLRRTRRKKTPVVSRKDRALINKESLKAYGLSHSVTSLMSGAALRERMFYWTRAKYLGVSYNRAFDMTEAEYRAAAAAREREEMFPDRSRRALRRLSALQYHKEVVTLFETSMSQLFNAIEKLNNAKAFGSFMPHTKIHLFIGTKDGKNVYEYVDAWLLGPTRHEDHYAWICLKYRCLVSSITPGGQESVHKVNSNGLTKNHGHDIRVEHLRLMLPIIRLLNLQHTLASA